MDDYRTIEDKASDCQKLLDFYIDLIENSKTFFKYYLSDDIVLDWFGQTVKGQKNVVNFIKTKVLPVKHYLKKAKPVNKIGYREIHVMPALKPTRRILRSTFLSFSRPTLLNTPKKQPQASTSSRSVNQLNSDSIQMNNNNDKSPTNTTGHPPESPRKRQKLSSHSVDTNDTDILECENDISDVRVKYLTAEGSIEFHRPSLKKLQKETKWQRPCKIHIAYDSGKDVKDSSIYFIIYEGNVKCRRNLLKDFEAEEPEE